jgi:hypothetical protein
VGGVGGLGLITMLFSHASSGVPVGNPYIDASQLNLAGGSVSFYDQPWRGYMETVPATQFLDGIGVNYNPVHSTPAQDNANLKYLASIGVHAIRIELPWDGVSPTDETQLTTSGITKYSAIFAACKQYGITPTVLLNANSGAPEPLYPTHTAMVVGTPKVGDNQITVSGIPASDITVHQPGTATGSSGINYSSGGQMAGNLITNEVTNSDGSLTLTLSQSLASVPGNIPEVTPGGTSGGTSYSYEVAAINSSGGTITVTPVGSTSIGNANLSSTNPNSIAAWKAVSGAASYNIYRTASSGTPSSTGLIGNITSTVFNTNSYFKDTGLAASGSVPTPSPSTLTIYYFKYMPLYPVGTPEFNNTMTGWLQYVKDATNTVEAAGITNYSVEIWNELTFGSLFLNINNYYPSGSPLISSVPSTLFSGGSMWELGNQTTQYLKSTYGSKVKVIWGFSNTTFYHTPSNALPANTDGESYHPYGTDLEPLSSYVSSNITPALLQRIIGGSYIPNINVALPEGANAATFPFSQTTNLIQGKLQPSKREASLPPGTTNFLHYITETGVAPGRVEYSTDPSVNQLIKAKAFLREYSFWLNKGLSQYDVFAAFDDGDYGGNDRGWNMLALNSDVGGGPSPVTAQSQAIGNFTSQFAGAVTSTNPRNLGVTVDDITPNDSTPAYNVFQADPVTGEPALNYREMFQFLPFQVTNNKFVISTYVMSWDLTKPPPPMDFQVDVTNVNGTKASASYYDPITNTAQPITIVSRSSTDMVLNIEAVDYPRTIIIDENGGSTPPDTTPPVTSISSGPSSSTTATTAAFSFSGTDNVTPAGSLTFQCSLDGAAYVSCTSPKAYSGLSVGSHTFNVKATDQAGNTDPTPASQTWVITSTTAVVGDLDGDGHVTGHDLSILFVHFGTNYLPAEFDGGTIVEGHDLSILLNGYGK